MEAVARYGNVRPSGLFYEWDEITGKATLPFLPFRLINMYPLRYPN